MNETPRDLKYRCLIEGLTDDPELIAGARFIDEICLREQGTSASEAKRITGKPSVSHSEGANTA